ncbi:MAG TPA: DUF1844 domain-containing protein [Deltaproteobacteria bacterium]|nr:DUF1844 domain-containing protein [Deltaproteobacteria bacterium]
MADEKKEEKKSYTFLDKRGVDHDEPAPQKDLKGSGAERKPEPQPSPDPGPTESQTRRGVPLSIDFTTLIMSFASAAMISMGRVEDPATGAVQKNLAVAQQNIDIITLLHEKTRGNLTAEEERLMDQVLYELRMVFVEAMKEER